ncbi:MAG TPA: AbrB/MazE/SpoVT family DNA-binding domain-containing protein [Solirubrobacteraceae bacterium]|nr:AbrB/MazE/SpoVT family DNA-binding domain-containing protein [Solirubrobacteraceae bacterium]
MTYKVGPKGQVVLPKHVRDRLGIEPGDEVTVEDFDDEVRIRRVEQQLALRGLLSDPTDDVPLTRQLELDHRWEIAHDEMRHAEWDMTPQAKGDHSSQRASR